MVYRPSSESPDKMNIEPQFRLHAFGDQTRTKEHLLFQEIEDSGIVWDNA